MTRPPVSIRYQDARVAQVYDESRFHSLGGRYKNWRLRRLLTEVLKSLPPGSTVLDVPCGTGRIDNWLLETPVRVIAADISSEMLEVARQKVQPMNSWPGFLRADASQLPFRSRSVDGVLVIRFLHLLDQRARLQFLHELARVTKRWALVEYRVERPLKGVKRAIKQWLSGRTRRRRMRVADIAGELRECGLVPERYYFSSRWFSGSVFVKVRCQVLQHARNGHVRGRFADDAQPADIYTARATSGPPN